MSSLRRSFRKKQKVFYKQSSKYYGINFKKIYDHLGEPPGELKDYHIDHIRPLASFDLTDPDEVRKAFSPENHQWLTREENIIKSDKLFYTKEGLTGQIVTLKKV